MAATCGLSIILESSIQQCTVLGYFCHRGHRRYFYTVYFLECIESFFAAGIKSVFLNGPSMVGKKVNLL